MKSNKLDTGRGTFARLLQSRKGTLKKNFGPFRYFPKASLKEFSLRSTRLSFSKSMYSFENFQKSRNWKKREGRVLDTEKNNYRTAEKTRRRTS